MNFVVTGATGWLGRASLDVLEQKLGPEFLAKVTAFASRAGHTRLLSGTEIPCHALGDIGGLPDGRYAFLHCAFLGKEKVADLPADEYRKRNEAISETVCAAARRVVAKRLFMPSSGAVYAKDRSLETDRDKNPYGVMKLADEERFRALAAELRCPLVIARVFNVAGPYINKLGSYALASILEDIRQGRPVALRAARPVIRSYVHVLDLMRLVLDCLADDTAGVTLFDTAGEREIEVSDLARLSLEVLGDPVGPIERPPIDPAAATDRYVGDNSVIKMLAGRYGISFRPLDRQIRDTADFLAGLI